MHPVKISERMAVDLEVALILLHMSSGLPWKEFLKQYYQRNNDSEQLHQRTNDNEQKPMTEINSPRKSARPKKLSNYMQKTKSNKDVPIVHQKQNGAIAKKAAMGGLSTRKRENAALERLRAQLICLPSRSLMQEQFVQKFIRK